MLGDANATVVYDFGGKTFGVIGGGFIAASLEDIITWLIVMFSVVICDLITEARTSIVMGKKVRYRRLFYEMMGKTVTYFSFVVMAVFIDHAAKELHNIDKWSILFICLVEGCTIISNILKPKGYNINIRAALSVFAKKIFGINREEADDIITKTKNGNKKGKD